MTQRGQTRRGRTPDRDDDYANAVSGAIVGALIGAVGGWLCGVNLREGAWLFPGDVVLAGAVLFGVLAYRYGHEVIHAIVDGLTWLP